MNVVDLISACRAAIDNGSGSITLVTRSTRLFGTRGPIGELLSDDGNRKVVRFDARKVLKFVEENL